jgi:hypothetical protein
MCNCLYSKIQALEKQAEADRAEIAELMEHKWYNTGLKHVLLSIGIMICIVGFGYLLHLFHILK